MLYLLLLLQKNMLVAEGVGRKLDADSNIWILARPLIEGWMRQNRGPQARLLEGAEELASLCLRLPQLVARVDRLLERAEENVGGQVNDKQFWSAGSSSQHRYRLPFLITIVIIFSATSFICGYLYNI